MGRGQHLGQARVQQLLFGRRRQLVLPEWSDEAILNRLDHLDKLATLYEGPSPPLMQPRLVHEIAAGPYLHGQHYSYRFSIACSDRNRLTGEEFDIAWKAGKRKQQLYCRAFHTVMESIWERSPYQEHMSATEQANWAELPRARRRDRSSVCYTGRSLDQAIEVLNEQAARWWPSDYYQFSPEHDRMTLSRDEVLRSVIALTGNEPN